MFTLQGPINSSAFLLSNMMGMQIPYLYTSPKEELLACRESAWLGVALNISPVYDVSGPDVIKFLNYICVNKDFAELEFGSSKHAIICNEKGQILADGVLIRVAEDRYRSYWLAPTIAYLVQSLGMDVEGNMVFDEFFMQIDGPKSLEIMERACQGNLHDLAFAQNKKVTVAGVEITIHRLGMSGCLAYEMHGPMQDIETVYGAILEAGKDLGIKQLGGNHYCRNHTQGGYPNQLIHYQYPVFSSGEEMAEYMRMNYMFGPRGTGIDYPFLGSASDDPENAFVTPFDIDWDNRINFDHEFMGKEALLEIKKNPPKKVVTLEWNPEDVGKVFASQFSGSSVEPTDEIIEIGDGGDKPFIMSKVLADGKMIGMTSGRSRDYYHRKMLSLAFIAKEYAIAGKELTVIWGTNPESAIEVRATVAAFPYYNEEYRNETFDVAKIPEYQAS